MFKKHAELFANIFAWMRNFFFRFLVFSKKIFREYVGVRPVGYYWDVIEHKLPNNGMAVCTMKKRKFKFKKRNIVISTLPKLLAGLMANEPNFQGIAFHMLGTGEQSWDVATPPPTFNLTDLTNEYFRKEPDSIQYVDGNGNIVNTVTSIIRIQTTFDFEEANGQIIREQGLVGGDATTVLGTGLPVNAIRHSRIDKTNQVRITRYIELVF